VTPDPTHDPTSVPPISDPTSGGSEQSSAGAVGPSLALAVSLLAAVC
jgi:hypothetical protein